MSENNNHDQDQKAARPQIERNNTHWLTLEHYNNDPEFMKKAETEFQSSPLREEDSESGWARREFLKLMGASLAMSAAGCIRRPVQKIVPYNKQPEEVTLGVANYYASTYFDGNEGLGVLVKTREGRPVKMEGNPKFPLNKGGMSVRAQSSLLNLYDPERLQGPKHNLFNEKRTNKDTINIKWDGLDDKVVAQLKKGGAVVLTGNMASPSTRAVVSDFAQAFKADHVSWEPLANEEIREGQRVSYGEALVPQYRFDKAKMIVSIDADFLGTWLNPTTFGAQFSAGRRDPKKLSKLISFDSTYSLTGANADIRFKIKASQQLDVVMGLINALVVNKNLSSYAGNEKFKDSLVSYANTAQKLGIEPALFTKVATDLWENKGQSLVVAGGIQTLTSRSSELQIAVNFLNSLLENEGKTIEGKNGNPGLKASYSELEKLIKDMNSGKVKTLIIHRVNPVYSLPKEAGFVEALKNVEMVVYTGDRIDEMGEHATYIAPDNHPLENWGDAEFAKDIFAIQQPAIRPMYDTRSFQLSLMTWAYLANVGPKRLITFETYYDYLRNFWKEEILPKAAKGKAFEDFWTELLQNGFVGELERSSSPRAFKAEAFSTIKPASNNTGFELVLYPTVQLGDGSSANNSWQQELPDPVTKIVWDNYVCVSIATAEKYHLKESTVVELKVGDKKVELPVHIQPGLHDEVLAVAVGYGRSKAGKVADGVGQNMYEFVSFKGGPVFAGQSASFTKTAKKYNLACVAGNNSMEGRMIVAEATFKDYLKNEHAGVHRHKTWSFWSGHQYNGHKWGMSVDLNTCTGCSACMTACQSENNVPVVGKTYVLQGREMHWLRVDRYFVGNPEDALAVFQPVMCQHCDNAPCETVCPVLATVHSDEGLNEMVYNRCVGTRYCSNNCPYKVRRFNWFNYAKLIEKPMHMALNPDVTVRTRGVMEKCTFCVHRIKEAKNKAKLEDRKLKDGDVKTACQIACPTQAIQFGDLNDPESQVAKIFKDEPRSYGLLEEWNAAPSVRYLSKIRNNDKETPDAEKGGH
ncbi:MAG: TAT-variant-translocated molybdopterin oxidoreductase [Pseudobdellovibrionaceae bacterium]